MVAWKSDLGNDLTAVVKPFVPGPQHRDAVDALLVSLRGIPQDAPVRLAKRTSNLFRVRRPTSIPGLAVSGLDVVLDIDKVARTADVAGMCTYENLVAATLAVGLSPKVVPQLKTITVGGAVAGLGIESASFRNGLVHESVLEFDILTGAGEILTARPDGEHADLFHGFPNSYGSLGYLTRVRLQLEPAHEYVALRHLRYRSVEELQSAVQLICADRSYDGQEVDYLDGVVFSATESYLTLGTQTDEPGPVNDYTGQQIYYRSIQRLATDLLTTSDYLWRWDTDWFWCSRAFGAQQRMIRRVWPKRLRRSSFYWKLVALDRRWGVADRIEKLHGRPPLERVVQDVEIPVESTSEFLRWFLDNVPIEPIWLCPLRMRAAAGQTRTWPLYPLDNGHLYVNVGFWSTVPRLPAAGTDHATNQAVEDKVEALAGHKSLYSDAFYSREQFDRLYGGAAYAQLKRRYDPGNRLLGMYEKTVGGR